MEEEDMSCCDSYLTKEARFKELIRGKEEDMDYNKLLRNGLIPDSEYEFYLDKKLVDINNIPIFNEGNLYLILKYREQVNYSIILRRLYFMHLVFNDVELFKDIPIDILQERLNYARVAVNK